MGGTPSFIDGSNRCRDFPRFFAAYDSIHCEAFNFLRQDHVVSSAHLTAKSILASRATKSNSSSVAMDLPQLGSQAKDELFLSSMKGNHQFAAAMTVFLRLRGGSRRTTRV